MTPNITVLPAELLLVVGRCLPHDDLSSLSLTCHSLRNLFTPVLFKRVKFTNNDEDLDVILQVLQKYGAHTEELRFAGRFETGRFDGTEDEAGDEFPALQAQSLPQRAAALLSHDLTDLSLHNVKKMTLSVEPDDYSFW